MMLGQVCKCSKGRLGVVLGRKIMPWGSSWIGVGLDGGGLWASRNPVVVADTLFSYMELLEKEVDPCGEP
jgi:hypothetical protein